MLTVQGNAAKRAIVGEAARVLVVDQVATAPMALLQPRPVIADDGFIGALRECSAGAPIVCYKVNDRIKSTPLPIAFNTTSTLINEL
jgi:hypothetical protein